MILNGTEHLFKYVACTVFEACVLRKRIFKFFCDVLKNTIQLDYMYIHL